MIMHVSRRRIVATGGLAAVLAATRAARVSAQVNRREPGSQGAVTPAEIDRRLEQRAAEIRRVAPQGGDRYVLFDLAYPHDDAEYRAVGKSALVFLAALSRISGELPIDACTESALGRLMGDAGPADLATPQGTNA